MNEKLALDHLTACGVEINLGDQRSPEEILAAMVTAQVIPAPEPQVPDYDPSSMSVAEKINC